MSTQPDQSLTPAGSEPALTLVRDHKTQTPAVPASSEAAVLDQNTSFAVVDEGGEAPDGGGDDGRAACRRLERDEPEGL